MKTKHILCTAATLLALSAGANAGVRAVDVPHITNGGTGYIGLTQSANQPQAVAMATRWHGSADATSSIPLRAGEASTMVDGRPNQIVQPTQSMGAAAGNEPYRHAEGAAWQGASGDPRMGMGTPK
jgi:hypothetical protein